MKRLRLPDKNVYPVSKDQAQLEEDYGRDDTICKAGF